MAATLGEPAFLRGLYGRFLIRPALRERPVYLFADAGTLAARSGAPLLLLLRELAVYGVLAKHLSPCGIDTETLKPTAVAARAVVREVTLTRKLLGVLEGSCRLSGGEVYALAELAKLNKVYLAYLRRVGGSLRSELLREEVRYRWFLGNGVEVARARKGLNYAFSKFRGLWTTFSWTSTS